MSRGRPGPGCFDLAFQHAYPLSEPAEVALEDYACALLRCRAAEVLGGAAESARVHGLHVCGVAEPAGPEAVADLEGFAREMASRGGDGGLGWS